MNSPDLSLLLLLVLALPASIQAVQEPPAEPAPAPTRVEIQRKLSAEAKECFEWFDTLGYPDVHQAKWAEIFLGGVIQYSGGETKPRTIGAFVLRDDGTTFDILLPDLSTATLTISTPSRKPWGIYYEERSFTRHLDTLLRQTRDDEYKSWSVVHDWVMRLKGRNFFMAYVAWKQGYPDIAQDLFNIASRWRVDDAYAQTLPQPLTTMRSELEWILGNGLMWRAMQALGGGEVHAVPYRLAPRSKALGMLRDLVQNYPRSRYVQEARDLIVALEKVEQEPKRPELNDAELQALPPEPRIKEMIHRLRNSCGDYYVPPEGLTIVDGANPTKPNSPVRALEAIGMPAARQLIDALADSTYTRTVHIESRRGFGYSIYAVSDLCEQVLRNLSRMNLSEPHRLVQYPPNADTKEIIRLNAEFWLRETTSMGEIAFLAREVASGDKFQYRQATRLIELDAETAHAAILTGAWNAEKHGNSQHYVGAVGGIPSDDASRFLLHQMEKSTTFDDWRAAVVALWNRGHPAALPALIGRWQRLSLRLNSDHNGEFDSLIRMLASTKDPQALALSLKDWDQRPAARRLRIAEVLGDKFADAKRDSLGEGMKVNKTSPEVQAAVVKFLVEALDDKDGSAGLSGSTMKEVYINPRVCDFALRALHSIAPGQYSYTNRCDRKQREQEILRAKHHWRHTQGMPETAPAVAIPPLPVLPDEKALQITRINIELSDHPEWKGFKKQIEAMKGRTFTPEMLAEIGIDYAGSSFISTSNLSVEAVRNRDLTGVTLNLQLRPRMPLEGGELTRVVSGELREKELLVNDSSVAVGNALEKESWAHLVNYLRPVLTAPPDADFILRVSLGPKE